LTGVGLLFQASVLFVGLIVFMLLQPFLTPTPFVVVNVVVIFVLGLVCFVPLAHFVRSVASKSGHLPDWHAWERICTACLASERLLPV
jgi:hypothetical protein